MGSDIRDTQSELKQSTALPDPQLFHLHNGDSSTTLEKKYVKYDSDPGLPQGLSKYWRALSPPPASPGKLIPAPLLCCEHSGCSRLAPPSHRPLLDLSFHPKARICYCCVPTCMAHSLRPTLGSSWPNQGQREETEALPLKPFHSGEGRWE